MFFQRASFWKSKWTLHNVLFLPWQWEHVCFSHLGKAKCDTVSWWTTRSLTLFGVMMGCLDLIFSKSVNYHDSRQKDITVYVTHINSVVLLSVIGDRARGDVHLPRIGECLVCCSCTWRYGETCFVHNICVLTLMNQDQGITHAVHLMSPGCWRLRCSFRQVN